MQAHEDFVNGIIAPIRASNGRKAKMREELLAHLDEAAKDTEAPQASMGDPVALRGQLQDSVPRLERLLHFRFACRRSGEGDLAYAVRCSGYALLFLLALVALAPIGSWMLMDRDPAQAFAKLADASPLLGALLCLAVLIIFANFYLDIRVRRSMATGDRHGLFLALGVQSPLNSVFAVLFFWIASLCDPFFALDLAKVLLVVFAGSVLIAAMGYGGTRWTLKRCPWVEPGRDI